MEEEADDLFEMFEVIDQGGEVIRFIMFHHRQGEY